MKLRQLAAEVREDLRAIRKALESRHCPPDCACRPKVQIYPNMTTSTAVYPNTTWTYTTPS